MKKWVVTATLVFASPSVLANESARLSGIYAGAGVGLTGFVDGVFSKNVDSVNNYVAEVNSPHSTVHFYVGYDFNRIVGIELAYRDYGQLSSAANETVKFNAAPHATSLSANIGYTFDTGIRAFGLAGVSSLKMSQSIPVWQDEQQMAFHYGAGAEYQPSFAHGLTFRVAFEADVYSTALNADYSHQEAKGVDAYIAQISSLYVGVGYQF